MCVTMRLIWLLLALTLSVLGSTTLAIEPEYPRVLWVRLALNPTSTQRDAEIASAIYTSDAVGSWFNHLALVVPSYQETPDAASHPLVKFVLSVCHRRGVPVFWGRSTFLGWPGMVQAPFPVPHAYAHIRPEHYAATLAWMKAEARLIGAIGTVVDSEPYGESPQKHIRDRDLESWEQRAMRWAVERAVRVTGPATWCRPNGLWRPDRYNRQLGGLGAHMNDSTYRVKPPEYEHDTPVLRAGETLTIDLWGSWCGSEALTIAEVRAFDLAKIQERYPECRGVLVYISRHEVRDRLTRWNDPDNSGPGEGE